MISEIFQDFARAGPVGWKFRNGYFYNFYFGLSCSFCR